MPKHPEQPGIALRLSCGGADRRLTWSLADGRLGESRREGIEGFPGEPVVELRDAGGEHGSWTLSLAASAWNDDVRAELELELDGAAGASVLWPRFQGFFQREPLTDRRSADFRGPGKTLEELPDDRRLALPFAVVETAKGSWLVGTDPAFSATVAVGPTPDGRLRVTFGWQWLAAAGVHDDERRRIFVVPVQDAHDALDRWFELATPDVPPGPSWVHDIALVNFDYLSNSGEGWFADLDAMETMIAPADRPRAITALHAWYDVVGRFCYDPDTKRLDDSWTAFPFADSVPSFASPITHPVVPGIPNGPANHGWRNLDKLQSVPMDWDNVRERLSYAKSRGIRTAFYVLTGMLSAGNRDTHIAQGTGLDIGPHWPGGWWSGPDLQGDSYIMNPLHPEVAERLLGYIDAVLEKVGDLTDALVMDESYYVHRGALGPAACPGYADRALMRLVQEIAKRCHAHRSDLAFFTSDELGMNFLRYEYVPYSVYSDGIFHDAWCVPESWDAVRFPTWRNAAWSVNWAPVTNLEWTRWGVVAHGAPVSISNGSFGDDTGISEVTPEVREQIAELWRIRTSVDRGKSFAIVDTAAL